MGVQGLWVLLEPVGRRVNIEALTNKRLAIDASIWLHQFLKAMRDEKGEVLKNAHLLGFFRRICRLLFHRVRPVFVFDGATPPLKRRTTIARRRQREQQTSNLRKTAEKLLLAQLKRHALTTLPTAPSDAQLARHLKQHPEAVDAAVQRLAHEGDNLGEQQLQLQASTAGDELLAAQLNAEGDCADQADVADLGQQAQRQQAAPSSTDHSPFKAAARQAAGGAAAGSHAEGTAGAAGGQAEGARSSGGGAARQGGEGDEEWEPGGQQGESSDESSDSEADDQLAIIPENADTLDPAVLSTLPPSLQLELMTKLREQKTYRNREEFSTRSGNPLGFSSFQMQQYLATSAVRRQMDSLKDRMNAAAMAGAGGAQAHRIAAQADREYILTRDGEKDKEEEEGRTGSQGLKSDSGNIELSLDLPSGASVDELFKPRQGSGQLIKKEESGDVDEAEEEEWEDVAEASQQLQPGGKQFPVPQNWRERMAQRQRFWSMSHGFQFGRKLADWGKGDEEPPVQDDKGLQNGGPLDDAGDYEEDQELQEAIRRSMQTHVSESQGAQPSQDSDDDIEWMSDDEPQVVHKAASAPTPQPPAKRAVQLPPPPRQHPAAAQKPPLPPTSKAPHQQTSVLASSGSKPASGSLPAMPSIPEHASELQLEPGSPSIEQGRHAPGSESECDTSAGSGYQDSGEQQHAGSAPADWGASAVTQDASVARAASAAAPDDSAAFREEMTAAAGSSAAAQDESAAAHGEPAPAYESVADKDETAKGAAPSVNQLRDTSAAAHESSGRHQPSSATQEKRDKQQGRRIIRISDNDSDSEPAPAQRASAAAQEDDDNDDGDDDDEGVMILQGAEEQPSTGATRRLVSEGQALQQEHASQAESSGRLQQTSLQGSEQAAAAAQPDPHMQQPGPSWQQPAPAPQQPQTSRQAAQAGPSSSMDVEAELESLEQQTKALQAQHRKQAGGVDTPTSEMFGECQELLQMFGLPYIIAPMEAEAQCAWLNHSGLVDGVVTDDNDVFLFGARHVYRHIFEDKKYVEEYRAQDMESELGIDRDALIRMALLLGSDYTEGVPGIGIVNALEIVRAFPTDEGLQSFREWVNAPDAEILAAAQGKSIEIDDKEPASEREFKRKHRAARRAWQMPEGFPNSIVIDAYVDPRVDNNKERFTYARPDLQLLRGFCRDKFGWAPDKVDQLLLPVLKAYEERQSQLTMDAFLSFSQRFAKVKSSRLQKALATGGPKRARDVEAISMVTPEKPNRQRAAKKKGKRGQQPEQEERAATQGSQEEQLLQGTGVFSLGEAEADVQLTSEVEAIEQAAAAEANGPTTAAGPAKPKRKRKASAPGESRRGQGRSRGRGTGRGRGRRKADPVVELVASSSDDDGPAAAAADVQPAKAMATRAVRKPGGYAEQHSGSSESSGADDEFEDV